METIDEGWIEATTSTHQDHVIAHVIGTTVLGHFVLRDAIHLLLDIGFIWKIYLDGEMGLLPHPVAIAEIEVDDDIRGRLKADIDLLLSEGSSAISLNHFLPLKGSCLIMSVHIFTRDDERKILLEGEDESLELRTSVTAEIIQIRVAGESK